MSWTNSLRAIWSRVVTTKTMPQAQHVEPPTRTADPRGPEGSQRPADLRTLYRCSAVVDEPSAIHQDAAALGFLDR